MGNVAGKAVKAVKAEAPDVINIAPPSEEDVEGKDKEKGEVEQEQEEEEEEEEEGEEEEDGRTKRRKTKKRKGTIPHIPSASEADERQSQVDILTLLFRRILLPGVVRASAVCRNWRDAATSPEVTAHLVATFRAGEKSLLAPPPPPVDDEAGESEGGDESENDDVGSRPVINGLDAFFRDGILRTAVPSSFTWNGRTRRMCTTMTITRMRTRR
jgi:hypothetical protein